jgi:hypothetical protein
LVLDQAPGWGVIMIDRRAAIRILLAALPAAWLAVVPTRAQDVRKLLPLLIDLPGWTGAPAQGVEFGSIGARRTYKRGDAMLEASFLRIVGEIPPGDPPFNHPLGTSFATAERHLIASTVDGFYTLRDFHRQAKDGQVLVSLRPNAFFGVTFKGVSEDDAFWLARRFDWKAIEAALPK